MKVLHALGLVQKVVRRGNRGELLRDQHTGNESNRNAMKDKYDKNKST
jgi:hypothetical protein